MNATADLTLELSDGVSRRALSAVLAPDNEGAPKGLLFSVAEGETTIRFKAESASLSTSVSTALAILRDVALFQEVWLLSQGKNAEP